jgi:hypothetical protein
LVETTPHRGGSAKGRLPLKPIHWFGLFEGGDSMHSACFRLVLSLGLACSLFACGAGGGSDGGDGGGGDAASGPTGLVPAAPTPGALLYAEASALRPLRAGSRWAYRTVDYTLGSFGQNTVKQTAAAASGSVQEIDSSAPTDVSTVSVDAAGNIVLAAQLQLFPDSSRVPINAIELKAAVRANEQVVMFDQRIANSGIDVDGDGRQDQVDLAIWRRVVGNEDIALPDLVGAMTALRVDTFVTVRVTPSAGSAPQTASQQASTWYAPGIGVVRSATPGTAGRPHDTDEVLLGHDGVTSGWGWLANEEASWEFRSIANRPLFAMALPDGALVDGEQTLYRLDRNGKLLASAAFTPASGVALTRGMLRFAGGTRIWTGSFPNYVFHSIDEDTAATSPTTRSIDLSGRAAQFPVDLDVSFMGDASAPLAWAIWQRSFTAAPSVQGWEIVLRRIDDTGLLGNEVRLTLDATARQVRAKPRSDGLVVTWVDYASTGEYTNKVVLVSNAGAVVAEQSWVVPRPVGSFDWPSLDVLSNDGIAWLLWNGPSATSNALSPHGLRLDALAGPVATTTDTASLLAATIDGLDGAVAADAWWSRLSAARGRWFTTARAFGLIYADDPAPRYWLDYRELDPGLGALGANVRTRMALRIPAEQPLYVQPIVFDDRVLLLTDDAQFVRATVIWRR